MNPKRQREVELFLWDADGCAGGEAQQALIGEEPLAIVLNDKQYCVMLRTPGQEREGVYGYLLYDGVIDSASELEEVVCCSSRSGGCNEVRVRLSEERWCKVFGDSNELKVPSPVRLAANGLCGERYVEDLVKIIPAFGAEGNVRIQAPDALRVVNDLMAIQPLRKATSAAHASGIYSESWELLASAEDVGRHNGVDKAIGTLLLNGKLSTAKILVLSSRISFELVHKASRARIPIVCSVSRPTSLAVRLGSALNMTLACLAPRNMNGLLIFCGKERFVI